MDATALLRVGLRKPGRGCNSRRLLSWFWPSSGQHSDQLRHAWPNVDDYLHINVASFGRIDRSSFGSIGFGVVGPKRATRRRGPVLPEASLSPASSPPCEPQAASKTVRRRARYREYKRRGNRWVPSWRSVGGKPPNQMLQQPGRLSVE
jgi:hypothetical protein